MKNVLLFATAFTLLFTACKKDDEIIRTAGKGGKATVRVKPVNDVRIVDSCVVYVTYNSKETGVPDDSVVQRLNNNEAIATFPQLRFGHYYFDVYAWDATAQRTLRGGRSYEVSPEDSSVNLEVAVQ